jgi:iron-sulfur cluster assembly protein
MIQLTDIAAEKIKLNLNKRGKGIGLRVGVKTTGCSGLAYVLEFVDEPQSEDQCYNLKNCKIFIDPKSSVYLTGLEIDWVKKGLNEGFEFINPNERDRCGCGESFRV